MDAIRNSPLSAIDETFNSEESAINLRIKSKSPSFNCSPILEITPRKPKRKCLPTIKN